MTIQTSLNDIIKVTASDLEKFQSILVKSEYSLDEVLDYDDGRSYQLWSDGCGTCVTLDVSSAQSDNAEHIITEIIDCWLELRAIRNALEEEFKPLVLTLEQKTTAFDQLMGSIRDFEAELNENEAMYKLMIKGEIDACLVSYYNLDEETRQAILQ